MTTRANVDAWKPAKLSEWAQELEDDTTAYEAQLGSMLTHFQGTGWQGAAYLAAYDRFHEENDQGRRLSIEIRDIATALRNADSRLSGERDALLRRVADAETDAECPVGLTVDDSWKVSAKPYTESDYTDEQKQKIKDRITHHQGLIDTGKTSLLTAVSEAITAINAASDEVRVRGDQLGNGLDVPTPTTVDVAALGRQDGETIADGKLSDAEIAQITARLDQAGLTPEQLEALANGQEVTVPASTMAYLENLYDKAGRDGLIDLADRLVMNGSPEALELRSNLADGLLTLSNEGVVTKDTTGAIVNRGGWDQLPPEVRELIGTRPGLNDSPDGNTRDLPDDYRANLFGPNMDEWAGVQAYTKDMRGFGQFLASSDQAYIPGERFGVELDRQAANLAFIADNGGYEKYTGDNNESAWLSRTEYSANDLLSVGARNNDSSYALLTGNGSEELFGKDVPGQSYEKYDPKVIQGIFQHDWEDNGVAAGDMIKWIGTESHEVGADGKLTTDALQAREALTALPDVLTPREDADDPKDDKPDRHRSGGIDVDEFKKTEMGFANNPELAGALATAMGSNLDAWKNPVYAPETQFLSEHGEAQLSVVDANRLLYLASQSEEGRLTLEITRSAYEADILNRAFSQTEIPEGQYLESHVNELAMLDGRISNAAANALTFQDLNAVQEYNNVEQGVYDSKKAAAKLVDQILMAKVDVGLDYGKGITQDNYGLGAATGVEGSKKVAAMLGEGVVESMVEQYIDQPDKMTVKFPDGNQLNTVATRDFQQAILDTAFAHGRVDSDSIIDPKTGRPFVLANGVNGADALRIDAYLNSHDLKATVGQYQTAHGTEAALGLGTDYYKLVAKRTENQGTTDNQDEK
ncbi:TPR repeat region-containing protein [Nocardia asteroides]|uniref:TPR repeat region-containing protein n=1 Tax=Nocardia asteroides TaxID=1824 RepID=UPI003650357C